MVDLERHGPWALVVGGSEGVGAAFAEQLAADGFDLVLVGRKPEPLAATAEQVRAAGREVRTLSADLFDAGAPAAIAAATEGLEIGLLILNAGANAYGEQFAVGDLGRFQQVVDLNLTARLALVHHFAGPMRERGRGGILSVGSLAGYYGSPYTSVYNAVKAFGRVFTEGLWYELGAYGVDVLELVIGATRTPAMERRGMTFGPTTADPRAVALDGLAHLADGPVRVTAPAGGDAVAERLSGQPRGPIVAEAAAGLVALGLYPPLGSAVPDTAARDAHA
jgi:short-subunit dehydrogenase